MREKKVLEELSPDMTIRELAERLGRTESSIKGAIHRFGILTAKPKGFLPNHPTWNKGTKGVMKSNSGTFKPGHKPKQHIPGTGHIRLRNHVNEKCPRKYIKVADGKWRLLGHVVWERENGPIPKGYVVRHLDGDALNCAIHNLECISRAENMAKNQNRKKAAKTLTAHWDKAKRMKRYGMEMDSGFYRRAVNIY